MDKFREFVEDDENDTLLFERLQQNALQNCPNPHRVGCPPHRVLAGFVKTPGKFTPAELNDLHILECAECTRELMALRQRREMRLRKTASSPWWRLWLGWRHAMAVGIACAALVVSVVILRNQALRSRSSQSAGEATVSRTIDLSVDGISRGTAKAEQNPDILLDRARTRLHLILPYFSAGGKYRVMLVKQRDVNLSVVADRGSAVAVGSHTELDVVLDLRQIAAGVYYLATIADEDNTPYFYRVHVD